MIAQATHPKSTVCEWYILCVPYIDLPYLRMRARGPSMAWHGRHVGEETWLTGEGEGKKMRIATPSLWSWLRFCPKGGLGNPSSEPLGVRVSNP